MYYGPWVVSPLTALALSIGRPSSHALPRVPESSLQEAGSVSRDQGVSLCRQVPVVEFNCSTFTKSFLKNQWEISAYLYGKVYKSSICVTKEAWIYSEKMSFALLHPMHVSPMYNLWSGGKRPRKVRFQQERLLILFWVKIMRACVLSS